MFHQLVSHNPDIGKLLEKGYAIAFDSNYLIIRDIPYLNENGDLELGAIVSKYVSVDGRRIAQEDHQVLFAGSIPHDLSGKPIPNLGGGPHSLSLSSACNDVVVERSFSNKPTVGGKFPDFFEKIESYVTIIAGPAISRHGANPLTYRAVEEIPHSVFKFHDTLTSRAEITELAERLKDEVVAIIGLGGTGAYLLDFLVRTPVKEIRAFDFDLYHVHNAFRSPGRVTASEFDKKKSNVYARRYKNFRERLFFYDKSVDTTCAEDLDEVTFAFVCVDKGSSRNGIFDLLIPKGISFIDVGMGLNKKSGPIEGLVRTTYYSAEDSQATRNMGLAPTSDEADDIYNTNIQISELNALNAALAVIKFKQLKGFYLEEDPGIQTIFETAETAIRRLP
ncbi:MAG: ThiF family adenylyltransferase [Acidobacteriota bacterium]|nr:MAG: ThiF family adenylyltransferase [Acidobacteriota bacterium]